MQKNHFLLSKNFKNTESAHLWHRLTISHRVHWPASTWPGSGRGCPPWSSCTAWGWRALAGWTGSPRGRRGKSGGSSWPWTSGGCRRTSAEKKIKIIQFNSILCFISHRAMQCFTIFKLSMSLNWRIFIFCTLGTNGLVLSWAGLLLNVDWILSG